MLLVSQDRLLIERLNQYCRKNFLIQITSSASVSFQSDFDAALVPALLLLDPHFPRKETLHRLAAAGCSLLVYGEARLLPGCFLAGCDDYLKEPWAPVELEWRLRRLRKDRETAFSFSWGSFELGSLELHTPKASCSLCRQEESILRLLITNRGQPVSRDALYYGIWGKPASKQSRAVDMHICSLRRKLQQLFPQSRGCIRSLRAFGYLIAE